MVTYSSERFLLEGLDWIGSWSFGLGCHGMDRVGILAS